MPHHSRCIVIGAALLAAAPAAAQSAFDGTWRADLSSVKLEPKPDVFAIKGGTYSCSSCLPAVTIKADGAFHATPGRAYADEGSVAVVDDHTVKYANRKDGKVVSTSTDVLSADGNTLTSTWSSTSNASGSETTGTATETRIAPAPSGAHPLSGSWRPNRPEQLSENSMTITMKGTPTTLTITSPLGDSWTGTYGGPYTAMVGDPGKTMSKAEKIGPNAARVTDMRQGKVVNVSTYTVRADGQTMDGTWMDPRNGSKGQFVAHKQ